jgi:hypothetical protein
VVNYLVNIKPIHKAERSFIRHREDLVTLRSGREHAWLDTVIEHVLRIFHCRFVEVRFVYICLDHANGYTVSILLQSKKAL